MSNCKAFRFGVKWKKFFLLGGCYFSIRGMPLLLNTYHFGSSCDLKISLDRKVPSHYQTQRKKNNSTISLRMFRLSMERDYKVDICEITENSIYPNNLNVTMISASQIKQLFCDRHLKFWKFLVCPSWNSLLFRYDIYQKRFLE